MLDREVEISADMLLTSSSKVFLLFWHPWNPDPAESNICWADACCASILGRTSLSIMASISSMKPPSSTLEQPLLPWLSNRKSNRLASMGSSKLALLAVLKKICAGVTGALGVTMRMGTAVLGVWKV
jgi:hypothetical protein